MSPGHLYAQVGLGFGTWPGSALSPWSCLGTSRALPPGGLRSRRPGQSTGQGPSTHSGICFCLWASLWHLAWFQAPEIVREQDREYI